MDNIASHENWKSCFSEIGPGLLLFARQWTRSAADAEDIVQEAFVKFWRRNHQINNRALLFATVAEADPTIEPQFEWADEGQSALAAAVSCLPHDQREVLVLKIWNELTFSEIAGALGISQNTAASRYRYALAHLKKSLQPQ
jgi:RNA polymerase sigma-70 factor (ECF subfamily)